MSAETSHAAKTISKRKPLTSWNSAFAFPVSRLRVSVKPLDRVQFRFFDFWLFVKRSTIAYEAIELSSSGLSKPYSPIHEVQFGMRLRYSPHQSRCFGTRVLIYALAVLESNEKRPMQTSCVAQKI